MKIELMSYISNEMARLKEMEKSTHICIDSDKIYLLVEEWMEKHDGFSMEELQYFFENVYQILYAELEIRKQESGCKGIWLTK